MQCVPHMTQSNCNVTNAGLDLSLADVKLQLSKEEALEAAQGKLPPHEVTPGVLLQVGLELEEKQSVYQVKYVH